MFRGLLFYTISFFLASVFFYAGINKLFPVNPSMHNFLVESSNSWGTIFQELFTKYHLPQLEGTSIRLLVGVSEVLGSIVLVLSPWFVGRCIGFLTTLGLVVIMSGAIYLHMKVDNAVTPPAVLLGLLIFRYLLTPPKKAKKD